MRRIRKYTNWIKWYLHVWLIEKNGKSHDLNNNIRSTCDDNNKNRNNAVLTHQRTEITNKRISVKQMQNFLIHHLWKNYVINQLGREG